MLQSFAIAVGFLALCAVTSVPAMAYSWSSCSRYETYTENNYNLFTDEWGATSGQCVYANSSTNWWSVANYSGGSGVQAYPDSEISLGNVNLSSLSSVNSSFNFSVTSGAPYYDAAYDLWTNGNVDEVMVWEQWKGNGPIASSYNCNQLGVGGCPFATNVEIDGVTYDVFQGNTGHNVVSFLRTSQASSGTVNLLDLMNWLANEGRLESKTFSTADFGFEIGDTNGSKTFTLNSFSVSTSTGGGGGGTGSNLIANGTYTIKNKNSGQAIDVTGASTTEGTYVEQWNSTGGTNQQWKLTNLGNNYVELTNVNSGLALDVVGYSKADGGLIDQWAYDSGENQIWKVVSEGGGYYELINENSGLALEVPNYSTAEGTDLDQWTVSG
ncbi:MAG: RICIN domain-containing protein, partial [Terracidiphilus sp.]